MATSMATVHGVSVANIIRENVKPSRHKRMRMSSSHMMGEFRRNADWALTLSMELQMCDWSKHNLLAMLRLVLIRLNTDLSDRDACVDICGSAETQYLKEHMQYDMVDEESGKKLVGLTAVTLFSILLLSSKFFSAHDDPLSPAIIHRKYCMNCKKPTSQRVSLSGRAKTSSSSSSAHNPLLCNLSKEQLIRTEKIIFHLCELNVDFRSTSLFGQVETLLGFIKQDALGKFNINIMQICSMCSDITVALTLQSIDDEYEDKGQEYVLAASVILLCFHTITISTKATNSTGALLDPSDLSTPLASHLALCVYPGVTTEALATEIYKAYLHILPIIYH
jgi:hypothetical protein